jgi:hypothetical protein
MAALPIKEIPFEMHCSVVAQTKTIGSINNKQ